MLCYKDMTFCVNDKCKKTCSKKLTEKITEEAEKFGLPLAVFNYFCIDCGEDNTVEKMS